MNRDSFWLIQRGHLNKKPNRYKTGVDVFVQWDYMGASEFEWGALPKSLQSLRDKAEKYEAKATGIKSHDGRELMLLCLPEDRAVIVEFLQANSKTRDYSYPLKERPELAEGLAKPEKYCSEPDVWWDIGNHWVAVLGEKPAEQVFGAFLKHGETR